MSKPTVLVTGSAGFIGFHLAQRLVKNGYHVVGIDNMNEYYDVNLKTSRNKLLLELSEFEFRQLDLIDKSALLGLFDQYSFTTVVNLAAQAGVRYSLENPQAYIDSNIQGFMNVLEACRHHSVEHLVYASSSSVYGANTLLPFSVNHNVDHPMSLYAATKKADELMAHTYSSLYQLPTTGLRFFTVYGPWGRPDMALFLFTKAILEGRPIQVFNNGRMQRDFTYIDDIIEGVVRVMESIPIPDQEWNGKSPNPATSYAPYRLFNIGNNNPVQLLDFIDALETSLQTKAIMELMPLQPGDVPDTFADIESLSNLTGFKPSTSIQEGISQFVTWYKQYYKVS